jgi:predicted ATPase
MGRDFSIDELSRACDSDEDVVESLDELCHRRIIREHGAGRFDFTHDRLREVAYWSVGPARRHVLHRRSADALAGAHASNLDPVSAQIAAHYEQGGVPEQAVAFYERAAGVATRIFANEETIGLIERALRILASLPDGIERQRRELALRIALCAPLRASRGWAHPELAENIARARTLADRVGIESERLTVLWQQVSIQFVAATDVRPALATAEEALRLAVESADPALLSPAHHWVGNQLCQRGEFARAREYLDRAVALYDRRYHARHLALFGADYGVLARVFNVHALWHLGYPDQAVGVSRDALALAEELLHPFSRAIALAYDATLHQFRRDVEATQRQTAALVALSTEYGFTYYTAWGKILHGWVLAQQGKARRSIPELRSGIEALDATGTELRRSYYLSLLAEAYGAQGEVHAGLRLIEEALLISERSGECWKDAELHRLRGCLLLAQGASAQEAEATFRHAIAVAQQQEARMLELRVSVSFGRLLQQLGRHTQAREMIAPILEWFTEGFDARDLVEARALLAELR